VWVGGGLLALVTAALAGALVMRTVAPASTPVPAASGAASAAVAVGQPVPPVASQPAAQSPAVAAAKPVPPSKPAVGSTSATSRGQGAAPAAVCTRCGVVESVATVKKKGEGTGLGAVAGGVLGGVAGHQVGGGNGKTAMTVLGAIGGGLAGNEVEKRARSETLYDIHVRMEDGSTRVFQRSQSMALGTRVVVEGTTLRVAN
jgi:outer membrane lipoprotein SlyB